MIQHLRERTEKNMKLKSVYATKEMITRLKRQPTEWEKIFASYTSKKELIIRIYRELKKLIHSPQINDPMKKWTNEQNRAFSKEEVQIAKNHTRKSLTCLTIKEMQIKTM
jgi:hypothetical protein